MRILNSQIINRTLSVASFLKARVLVFFAPRMSNLVCTRMHSNGLLAATSAAVAARPRRGPAREPLAPAAADVDNKAFHPPPRRTVFFLFPPAAISVTRRVFSMYLS